MLLVEDVDFDIGTVHFRPNEFYRQRKSKHATRTVPLWPQLRSILLEWIGDRTSGLLFSAPSGNPFRDVRGSLKAVFGWAGIAKPNGKAWHLFRHTYTTMRLQTLDGGHPVAMWTVARELGHCSVKQIEDTYGHLLHVRDRKDRVEYTSPEADRGLRLA